MRATPLLARSSHEEWAEPCPGRQLLGAGGQSMLRTAEVIYKTSRQQTHNTGSTKKGLEFIYRRGGGGEVIGGGWGGGLCFE